jgi:hypothetical protein
MTNFCLSTNVEQAANDIIDLMDELGFSTESYIDPEELKSRIMKVITHAAETGATLTQPWFINE